MICELQMAKANQDKTASGPKQWDLYMKPELSASYYRLIDLLISPSSEIESCNILITDSVFLGDDGKPILFAKTDRDGRVTSLHNKL